jgi:hypothetical protein
MKKRVYDYLEDNFDDLGGDYYESISYPEVAKEYEFNDVSEEGHCENGFLQITGNEILFDQDTGTELSGYNEWAGRSQLGNESSWAEWGIYEKASEADRAAQYYRDNYAYQYDQKKAKKDAYWADVEETRKNSRQYDAENRERVRKLTRERVKRHREKKKAANENKGFGRDVA